MMSPIDNDTTSGHDILVCIQAMRRQEDEVSTCINYLQFSYNKSVDASSRTAMVTWCQELQKKLKLSPETVWIAISFFDRYLSSGKSKSCRALQDKYQFQLVSIVSFYISVKLYEKTELTVDTLVKIRKGYYAKRDIIKTEEEILFALDYRLATPTPMQFVKEFIKMLLSELELDDSILDEYEERIAYILKDIYYTFYKPSVVGAACLISILTDLLSSTHRQAFYLQLSKMIDIIGVMEVQSRDTKRHTKPARMSTDNQTKDIKQIREKQTPVKQTTMKAAEESIKTEEDTKKIAAENSEAKDEPCCYARCA